MKSINILKIVILTAIFSSQLNITAQNLVLNPSFETVNTSNLQCSWYTNEAQFTSAMSNWDYPTNGTTDIFHTSLATSCYGHPMSSNASSNGQQMPRTGNSMVNIVTYGSGGCTPYREYLQGQLSTPLTSGTTYAISLYVSLVDNCDRGTNNIGIKFTTTRQNTGSMCVWNTAPSANYTGTPITNKTGWTLVTMTYTPTGAGQQYFSIGNFITDASTTTTYLGGSTSTIRYFVDDVSVVPACNITAQAGPNRTTTCTNPTAVLSGSQTGGSGAISYSWSPSTGLSSTTSASPTANPSSTTTYTLTTTDGSGCTDTDVVTVTVNKTAPTANAGSNATTTCTTPTAVLSGSGGGSYAWSPATGLSSTTSATPTANPSSTTNYTLTVTGSNGCTDTDVVTVTVNETAPNANAGSNVTTTCTTPTAVLSGSGGGSYAWSPATGLSSTTSATPTANPSSTTNYTLTVTSANGCTDTDVVTVTVNETAPNANAGANVTNNCTSPTGTLSGSGGGSYAWSPTTGLSSSTSATPTVNPASTTNYTLTVTGSNGCTDTDVVTVTVDKTAPNAEAGSNVTTTCTNPTAVLAGSGGGSYAWSPATGLSSTTSATPTANPSSNQTYTLTVTGSNGCTDTDVVTVTVNETVPTANAGGDATTTCTTPTTVLSGSGGGSYAWSPATGLSSTTSATPTANPSSTTNYTLTVTSANGCSDTDVVTVTVDETSPNANAGADVTNNCTSPTGTLSGSGGGSYLWSPTTGLSSSTSANPTVNPSTTTNYTLTVTAANGCTDTDLVTVTVDKTIPTANAGSDVTTTCSVPSTTLTGSGGGSYLWSPAAGLSSTTTASPVATPVNTTNYTLTVTSANGCSHSDEVTISVDANIPTANAGADFTTTCTNPTIDLTGTGGGTYAWSPATGLSSTNTANTTANPSATTTYTLTVTAANGCTHSNDVTITVDETSPAISAGSDIHLDCSTPSATFAATGSGTISWTTPTGTIAASSAVVTDASPTGLYTVNIVGANGCTNSDDATLTIDITQPVADAGADQISNCATPTVTLDGSNSSGAGISYAWTGPSVVSGGSTNTATADAIGQYTLTVTGSNGCIDADDVTVSPDNNYPLADAGSDQILDCNNLTVILDGSGSDSGSNITYEWTTGSGNIIGTTTNATSEVDLDATYTLTVTNTTNGCASSDNAGVVFDTITPIGFENNGTYTITCSTTTITLDASASSGTGNSYVWSTTDGNIVSGGNTPNPIVNLDGTYNLNITSANGCSSISITTVLVAIDTISPTINIAYPDTLTCDNPITTIDASSSQSGVTYNWTTNDGNILTGQTTSIITADEVGEYSLEITSANGCVSNLNQTVIHSDLPVAIAVANPMTGTIPLDVDFTENSIGSGLLFDWDLGFGDTVSTQTTSYTFNTEGSYDVILTIMDQYGCIDSDTLTIEAIEVAELVIPNIFTPNEDGSNDIFKIKATGVNSLNATILNRWGQIIFTWDTTEGGWDGRSISGSLSSEGTYYYVIEAEFLDGTTKEYKGPFSLAR